jgi:branched-chain amino acid transport system permease protein
MELFAQHTVNGIAVGMSYLMFAMGFALIFGVTNIINFSHGEFLMLAAMLTYFLMTSFGLGYFTSIPLVLLILISVALISNRVAVQPLLNRPNYMTFAVISTMGLSMFFSNLAVVIWTADYKHVYSPLANMYASVGGIVIEWQKVLLIAVAAVCIILLMLFLHRTMMGNSIRAAAQNKVGAAIVGINVNRVYAITFVIACTLSGIAGWLVAPSTWAAPYMGLTALLKGFVVVVLTGLGNITGVIGAGLLLGLAESYFGAYVSYTFTDAFTYSLIMVLLIVRPQGLFARIGGK